jgi:hypothetical protein
VLEFLRSGRCLFMNIGAIPVAELLAHIGRPPLCPHHLAPAVEAASLNAYSLRFPYEERIEMCMKISFPTVS